MAIAVQRKTAGRPRKFDEQTVLEAAMDAFWRGGYEATSVADLCTATGLHKGSLYQAFGDKQQLFLRSLRHYDETSLKVIALNAHRSDSALKNLREMAVTVVANCVQDQGCLAINSIVELAPHDPEVKAILAQCYQSRLRLLSNLVHKAQCDGEIANKRAPERLAKLLMMTLAGIAVSIKGFADGKDATAAIEDLLDSWQQF